MQIIPAIDIIDGKCVRLTQGDFKQAKTYHVDPVEVAKKFEDAGLKRLHLVDLDGARSGKVVNAEVLRKIVAQTKLVVDFGGGIQSDEDIEQVFSSGAYQITGGSIAVKAPDIFERWLKKYGKDRIILGADVKNKTIAISGWQESSELELFEFLKNYIAKGIQYVICTDVSKDGLLKGPAINLYQQIAEAFPDIKLIASGGVSSIYDLEQLKENKIYGVIIGKAIYEKKIHLADLKYFI